MSLMLKAFGIAFLITSALLGIFLWYVNREPKLGGDFTLNLNSQSWNFTTQAKPLNLLYIGYAKCPDVCPMSLTFAAQAFRQLSADDLKKVQFIFISVDHANDTAQNVFEYARQFYPDFIGLSGNKEQLDLAINTFKANYFVEKDPKSYLGYSIAHPDRIYFLDSKGIVIDTLSNPRSHDSILEMIKKNL